MNKDYTIHLKEEATRIGVYLVPKGISMKSNSPFKIKVGFIDLDENPFCFHCIDSDRMTLAVMESIVFTWRQWELTQEPSPI